jgi:hypothetical protein
MRSYHDFALGLALLLFAAAVVRTDWAPRPIAYLMGLSGLTYLVQGWVAAPRASRQRSRSQSCWPGSWAWHG